MYEGKNSSAFRTTLRNSAEVDPMTGSYQDCWTLSKHDTELDLCTQKQGGGFLKMSTYLPFIANVKTATLLDGCTAALNTEPGNLNIWVE